MHVGDEETAIKADAVFHKALSKMKNENFEGAVSATRTVCKTEWAYEIEMVFEVDAFKNYMESDFREQTMQPILKEITNLAVDPDSMYMGNRVWNRYDL